MPALLPDGAVSPLSVNRIIARHEAIEGTIDPEIARILQEEALAEQQAADTRPTKPLDDELGDTEPLADTEPLVEEDAK